MLNFKQIDNPLKFHNYAKLRVSDFSNFMDVLRYEESFLMNVTPKALLKNIKKGQFFVLLCKPYINLRSPWLVERLMSWQKFEFVESHREIEKLQTPYKYEVEMLAKGTFEEVLALMIRNKAFPATEGDSNIIQMCQNSKEVMNVNLKFFSANIFGNFKH